MSSKESTSDKSSDTLILEAPVELCNQIRGELVQKFEFCWFYVLNKSAKNESACILAANAFGGKLDPQMAEALIEHAKERHAQATTAG